MILLSNLNFSLKRATEIERLLNSSAVFQILIYFPSFTFFFTELVFQSVLEICVFLLKCGAKLSEGGALRHAWLMSSLFILTLKKTAYLSATFCHIILIGP